MVKIGKTDERFLTQQKKVFAALFKQPLTMLQIEKRTGIMRSNVTWFIARWMKEGVICITKRDVDPLTARKANYYSSSKEVCRFCQGKLFEQ